jgi:hypothetical protein
VEITGRKAEHCLTDPLRRDILAALKGYVEIREHNLPCGSRIAAQGRNREGRGRNDVIAYVLAARADLRNRGANIDRPRISAARWVEQGDVAGARRNTGDWTSASNRVDAAAVFGRDIARVATGAK